MGIISFNGNKIISTGGGGIILTNNKKIADKAKHISKTSKLKKNGSLSLMNWAIIIECQILMQL